MKELTEIELERVCAGKGQVRRVADSAVGAMDAWKKAGKTADNRINSVADAIERRHGG